MKNSAGVIYSPIFFSRTTSLPFIPSLCFTLYFLYVCFSFLGYSVLRIENYKSNCCHESTPLRTFILCVLLFYFMHLICVSFFLSLLLIGKKANKGFLYFLGGKYVGGLPVQNAMLGCSVWLLTSSS